MFGELQRSGADIEGESLYFFYRLLDVIHSQKKLYIVFEYLNQDLKKYMDSCQAGEFPLSLVKVQCGSSANRQGRQHVPAAFCWAEPSQSCSHGAWK